MIARNHAEQQLTYDDETRANSILPLLQGSPLGAAWLIGPARAPLGYVIVTFGWSLRNAGMTGWVDDIFVRSNVRRRGIATECIMALSRTLQAADVQTLSMRSDDDAIKRLAKRVGMFHDGALTFMTSARP